jgi:ubiquinone/menaquinone biosynthesis C-methylase UbiE
MGWYARHVLPRLTDCACGSRALSAVRARTVARASGSVLEIGFGSGTNLRWFASSQVTRLLALEPSRELIALARARIARQGLPAGLPAPEFIAATAEEIPLPDASLDSIVVAFTLCSVRDPERAGAEMHRVLRPGGAVYYAEHGLAATPWARRWQRLLEPAWTPLAGGCHLTRDPTQLFRQLGFVTDAHTGAIGPPTIAWRTIDRLFPGYWGSATRP